MNSLRWTRRAFCAAAPAALYCCQAPASPAAHSFSLRYTLATSLFGTTSLDTILPEVQKLGVSGIDLLRIYPGDQREQVLDMGHERFAALLRQYHVRLDMTTRPDLGPFGLRSELGFLASFGGKMVVTGSAGPRDLSGPGCKRAVMQFVQKMKPVVAEAETHGVTIAIQNHALSLLNSPDSIRYFADLSPSPNLGIAFAPFNLPQDEKLLAGLIEDIHPRLVHFYAGQFGRGRALKLPTTQELEQMPGRGKLDFRPLMAALRKTGYTGAVEIFMQPVPGGDPILEATSEVTQEINHARDYLEQCLRHF